MRYFLFLTFLLIFTVSCSYTPECKLPADNELSNPSDIIEYNGNILIVNADSSMKFCNGYVSEMNIETGEVVKKYEIGDRDTSFLGRGAIWKSEEGDLLLLTERGGDSLIGYNFNEERINWRISTGDDPLAIALDQTRDLALVANLREDTISVIQLAFSEEPVLLGKLFLPGGLNGYRPTSIILSTDRKTAYVTGRFYPRIYKINMDSLSLDRDYINIETTVSGLDTRDIVEANGILYVAMRAPPAIGIINSSENRIINFFPAKSDPYGIELLSGQWLFVTEYKDNILLKIDLTTGRILDEISVGDGPGRILITSDQRYLFTANYRGNNITRIDLNTWEVKELP